MSKVLAKNAFILVSTEILSKFLEFVSIIFFARILGVEKYGIFSFICTIGLFFSLIPHFGFDQMVVRDISRDKSKTGEYLLGITIVKLILSLLAFSLLFIWLRFFSGFDIDKRRLLYIGVVSFFSITNILFTAAFFRAHQKVHIEAFLRVLLAVLVAISGIIIAFLTGNILYIFATRLIICVLLFLLSVYLIKKYLSPVFIFSFHRIFFYLKQGWSFAVFISFVAIYICIDVVMLNMLVGNKATGLYHVASRILLVFAVVPTGICNAALPLLSAKAIIDKDDFLRIFNFALRYLIIIATFVVMGGVLMGKETVVLVFGQQYNISGTIFAILCWAVFPSFMGSILGSVLISVNKEKVLVFISIVGAVANIGLNFIFIPRYSYYGAMTATLFTEALIFFLMLFYVKRQVVTQWNSLSKNIVLLGAGVLLIVIMKVTFGAFPYLGCAVGMMVYCAILFKLKYLDLKELKGFVTYLLRPSKSNGVSTEKEREMF